MSSRFPPRDPGAPANFFDPDRTRQRTVDELQRQLDEASATIKRLKRELAKEQARHAETSEAYTKTVSNMVEIARENAILSHELDRLRRYVRPVTLDAAVSLPLDLTPEEARAIRKAMARLHHPDVGGDEQRMKQWNVVLDRLDAEK